MSIKQKIKNSLFVAATLMTFAAPLALSTSFTFAACSHIANKATAGASGAATGSTNTINCDTGTGVDDSGIATIASKVVDVFSLIVGAVAVIMVIYGGFRYITSGGDSGRVGNAKNTLIYAIVGLVIVAFAQLIVHFVLNQAGNATTPAT